MNRIQAFLKNLPGLPERLMAKYLKKKGWTVFWLDENIDCKNKHCWLQIYRESEARDAK